MKVAILAENRHGFVKPMAEGLMRMLTSLDCRCRFYGKGLAMLDYHFAYSLKIQGRNWLKKAINSVKPRSFELQHEITRSEVEAFENQLLDFDLIVVVCPLPKSFIRNQLPGIERLRQRCKAPVVLYQNYYLATRGDWADKIRDKKNYGGGFGLERYDWYFGASVVSEDALSDKEHPFTLVGHDLRGDNLKVTAKDTFKVLLDFEQKGFEDYRQLQLQALKETGIPYTALKGRYSQDEIRALYRVHSALFLSFRESFGLPIVENQLCGNLIFTPFCRWAPSHFINKPIHQSGEGSLGDNFVVYDNDLARLKSQLLHHQAHFDAQKNLECFIHQYPHLYQGDLNALSQMLKQVADGKITGDSHLQYHTLV